MANRKKLKWNPTRVLRYLILGSVLVYVTLLGILHLQDQIQFPPVDALCPYGGLESLFSVLFQGRFLHRIFSSSLILLVITVVLVFFSGRSFCGVLCPLGTIQGVMHKIGGFFLKNRPRLFLRKDKYFRWLRYLVLVIFTLGAWIGGRLLIRPYDPWVTWMHLSDPLHAFAEFPIGVMLTLLILVASLILSRPFCRYLCPMGGFLAILNKISPFKVKREASACSDCSLCRNSCPVGIDPSQMNTASRSECISCGECVEVCPGKKALSFRLGSWVFKPLVVILVVVIFFSGSLLFTQATGLYKSTNHTVEELKNSGSLEPEQIKGYMTLGEVAYLFDLAAGDLYTELDLDSAAVPTETACKDVAEAAGREFSTDEVRLAVGRLLNLPQEEITTSCAETTGSTFIPGTMTLREVSQNFGIPLEVLYTKLRLNMRNVPPETQCRELKFLVNPDFHTTVVRQAVAELSAE